MWRHLDIFSDWTKNHNKKSWLCSGKTWSCSLRYVFTLGPPPNTVNLSDVNFDTKNSNFVTGLFSHDITLIHINPDFSPNNVFSYRSTKNCCAHNLKLIALRAFTLGPSPNVSNSSNINLDTEWLHESTPFTDIYRSQLQSLSVVIFWSCKIKKKEKKSSGIRTGHPCIAHRRHVSEPGLLGEPTTFPFSLPTYSDIVG